MEITVGWWHQGKQKVTLESMEKSKSGYIEGLLNRLLSLKQRVW